MAVADGIRTEPGAGGRVSLLPSLLAIDPGTTESGWVLLGEENNIRDFGIDQNTELVALLAVWKGYELAVEVIEARGMPLGHETIRTILWTGRFIQASPEPDAALLVERRRVKSYLCGSQQAKDANIRQALINLYPPTGGGKVPQIGLKGNEGPLYGITKHAWAALGVAATVRGITQAVPR